MAVDESALWVPQSEQDRDMVRVQMERLLETHHFRNSRRYPALFRFIIEEALAGRGEYLKERLIGVHVFGRPADYDTAADPVVRVTVSEIRKRIAQYYHDQGHDHEMRIELVPGSYEPEFRPGRDGRLEHLPHPPSISPEAVSPKPQPAIPIREPTFADAGTASTSPHVRPWYIAGVIVFCAFVVAAIGAFRLTRHSAVQDLWAPLVSPGRPVMLVLPIAGGKFGDNSQPQQLAPVEKAKDPWTSFLQLETGGENVVFSDVTAMMGVSSLLATKHAEFRLRLNNATTLDDLRQGPVVLIGGMDNQWTLRVLDHLRYRFAGSDADAYWIQDSKDPGNRQWSLDLKTRIPNVTRDYALIARVHDETTGEPELIVAGIGMSGTAAAGELVVSAQGTEELRRLVGPQAFRDRDFEAVLRTDVVNGSAGSAKVLTVEVQ